MNVTITMEGLVDIKKAFEEATEEVKGSVRSEIERSTIRVHAAAVKRIQRGPATGRVYELYMPRRTHQASAPDEPAMSDEGQLASSVQYTMVGDDGVVFSDVKHAVYTELGTTKMQPRPWLFPSLEEEAPSLRQALRGILK